MHKIITILSGKCKPMVYNNADLQKELTKRKHEYDFILEELEILNKSLIRKNQIEEVKLIIEQSIKEKTKAAISIDAERLYIYTTYLKTIGATLIKHK